VSIRRDFPDLPPVWAVGVLTAQALAAWLLPVILIGPVTRATGWVPVAIGLGLIGWSAWWFRAKRTSIEPRETPKALIVEGPFRLNRNPIYAGMAAIVLGAALIWGSPLALVVVPAFLWIVTRRFVLGEEAALIAAFGDEARRYIAASRRW
jgi:protein-S-isoprenylcysteine O-methyltransferase Ste14